jgi:hypothetical protein
MRSDQVETATAVRGSAANDDPVPIGYERERELRQAASAVARRRVQKHELASIRAKLRDSAAGHVSTAAGQLNGRVSERIPDSDWASFRKAVNAAIVELDQADRLSALEGVSVVSEPSVYGPDSPHSWFRDLAATLHQGDFLTPRTEDMAPKVVEDRLDRHVQDVQREARKGTEYGRAVKAMLRESCREENEHEHRQRAEREFRVLTGGGGATAAAATSMSVFVSPAFLVPLWAPYRGVQRSFADQCHSEPLPPYGMNVYVPVFTGTDKVAKQAEEGNVTETIPTTGLEGSKVETLTGQVIITQQLLDRAITGGGGGFDELLGRELAERLDQEVDLFALNTAITNGEAVTGESTYSTEGLYKDLALAREKLSDTAGTRLRPTHMFTTSDLYSYATRQVDATTKRPILAPWVGPPGFPPAVGADALDGGPEPQWSRFTGTIMPGGVLWFTDDNIPVVGTSTRTQIVVSAPEVALVLVEGSPIVTAFRETLAHKLEVIVNLRNYVAVITRHAAGSAIISSSGYTTGLV